ncbi:hypothetical protein IGW14_32210 [Streptomyces hygroscopicus subsp. hygroscopicus]|uniref:hypothetical protein n=1 Tax=Streptomyces hygroscopicus TaxID=1912 RepID=UPI001C65999B|nr:hypothetical protein [Streptomyces hygroscopicus]MBW8092511.1 hypothetical protein [Streptomyces hygroscopicus subsp. hygroscopicus]
MTRQPPSEGWPVFVTAHRMIASLVSGIPHGVAFGALFCFVGHSMTGGRRDVASRSQIAASRYGVVADAEVVEEAKKHAGQTRDAGEPSGFWRPSWGPCAY